MKKYKVTVKDIYTYEKDVFAECESDAENIVWENISGGLLPTSNDSFAESEEILTQ